MCIYVCVCTCACLWCRQRGGQGHFGAESQISCTRSSIGLFCASYCSIWPVSVGICLIEISAFLLFFVSVCILAYMYTLLYPSFSHLLVCMPVWIWTPVCACVCTHVCPAFYCTRAPSLFVLVAVTQSLIVLCFVFLLWPQPDLGALKGPAA